MTKKRIILFVALVWMAGIISAFATPVSEQEARRVAADFLRQHLKSSTRSLVSEPVRAATGAIDDDHPGVYVFNAESGFVVVSAETSALPVLGYSDGAPYEAAKAPVALKTMLKIYDLAVRQLTRAESVPLHEAISPLLTTKWDQAEPYNYECPLDTTTNETSLTGCSATAMAQVMRFHNYPDTYDWADMKDVYTGEEGKEDSSAKAVARLMADCANALLTEFGSEGSGAYYYMLSESLRNKFGYDFSTDFIERSNYSAKSWDALIYHELADGRPLIYVGQSVSANEQSGHAFVVDGYDGNGYYHVNWGWSGYSNGYFHLSVLNPDIQGTGGNAGSSGYSFSQAAVVGIKPATEQREASKRLYLDRCYIENDKGVYSRNSTSENFPAFHVNAEVFNALLPEGGMYADVCFALCQGNEVLQLLESDSANFPQGTGYRFYIDKLRLGSALNDGKYQIRILCRENGSNDWAYAFGALDKYVELVISGLTMTTLTYGYYYEEEVSKFKVNSVDVGKNNREGKIMHITVNLTDQNNTYNAPIFLWGNASLDEAEGEYQLLTGGGTNLEPGETGDVLLTYTPERTGSFKFILSGSAYDYDQPLYTFEAEVAGISMAEVVMPVEVSVNAATTLKNGTHELAATDMRGTIRLTNNGTEDYDDIVTLTLLENTTMNGTYTMFNMQNIDVSVPVGQTVEVPFAWEGLNSGNYYAMVVYAVEKGTVKGLNLVNGGLSASSVYHITATTGIETVGVEDKEAEVFSLQGVRIGKSSDLQSLPKGLYIINKKKVINK